MFAQESAMFLLIYPYTLPGTACGERLACTPQLS
jgi:hypothetical protein